MRRCRSVLTNEAERIVNKPLEEGILRKRMSSRSASCASSAATARQNFSPDRKSRLTAVFAKGDIVSVVGTSKGRGFQGVVKRHHFGGGFRTHGQSDRERAPGSIGSSSYPSRVFKGHADGGTDGRRTGDGAESEGRGYHP